MPYTYCSSAHKNWIRPQKHQKPASLKIAEEKGKKELKLEREFLNTVYSSFCMWAGASYMTSVNIVLSEDRHMIILEFWGPTGLKF